MFGKDRMSIIGDLQGSLADVFENHRDPTISLANFWNSPDGNSADGRSISLTNFIEFVVTPHIANLLIAEDLHVSEECANGHRLRSRDVGSGLQYGDDNDAEVDRLIFFCV
jgi:hypothetical protein